MKRDDGAAHAPVAQCVDVQGGHWVAEPGQRAFCLRRRRDIVSDNHFQAPPDSSHGSLHPVEARAVLHVQHAVDLRQMPAEAPGQLRLADTLFPHAPVENHLDGGEGRQRGAGVALGGWRDLPAVVDSGRDCLL